MTDAIPSPEPAKAPEAVPPAPPAVSSPAEAVGPISIEDFAKIKLVTAEVISAVPHPKADRLLILHVKTGETTKQIVSGIRQFYTPEALVGKTVVVVDNLQPAKLRGEMSHGMILAVRLPDGGLRLLTTDTSAPSGLPVS